MLGHAFELLDKHAVLSSVCLGQFLAQCKNPKSRRPGKTGTPHHIAKKMRGSGGPATASTNEDALAVGAGLPEDLDGFAHAVEVNPLNRVQQLGSVFFGIFHNAPRAARDI
jgi:hypothetical protein